jgi:hypothetical protein
MRERVNTVKPVMLYTEVRAFETQKGMAEQSKDKVAFASQERKGCKEAKWRMR